MLPKISLELSSSAASVRLFFRWFSSFYNPKVFVLLLIAGCGGRGVGCETSANLYRKSGAEAGDAPRSDATVGMAKSASRLTLLHNCRQGLSSHWHAWCGLPSLSLPSAVAAANVTAAAAAAVALAAVDASFPTGTRCSEPSLPLFLAALSHHLPRPPEAWRYDMQEEDTCSG